MSTTLSSRTATAKAAAPAAVPPLENGDRLTRKAFLERYRAMPALKKAERIEGVVYMQAAVRYIQHGGPHSDLVTWMGVYRAATPGVEVGDNSTVLLDLDNEPQPDAFLRIAPACGGQSRTTDAGYVAGAPELIGEVASSSASLDLHDKMHVYRRNGVLEYIVWKVIEHQVEWFRLCEGHYQTVSPDVSGIYHSEVFPGLWLDADALLGGDLRRVLEVVQRGVATAEHRTFVEKLAKAQRAAGA